MRPGLVIQSALLILALTIYKVNATKTDAERDRKEYLKIRTQHYKDCNESIELV